MCVCVSECVCVCVCVCSVIDLASGVLSPFLHPAVSEEVYKRGILSVSESVSESVPQKHDGRKSATQHESCFRDVRVQETNYFGVQRPQKSMASSVETFSGVRVQTPCLSASLLSEIFSEEMDFVKIQRGANRFLGEGLVELKISI